jgi:hypothetical protein
MDVQSLIRELDAQTAQGAKEIDPEASAAMAAIAISKASEGRNLSKTERDALKDYVKLFEELLRNPSFRARLKDMQRLLAKKSKKNT